MLCFFVNNHNHNGCAKKKYQKGWYFLVRFCKASIPYLSGSAQSMHGFLSFPSIFYQVF